MEKIEKIAEEVAKLYPETPQAAYEAAKLAGEKVLNEVKSLIDNHLHENLSLRQLLNILETEFK